MTTIEGNLQQVHERLARACKAADRDVSEVTLLAVSKTFDADAVCLALAAGQHAFGENYVQEGTEKIEALRRLRPDAALQWHCIGPLQSNKTRPVADHFDWVQSVDRLKIAQRLSEQRPTRLPPLQVCLQVNVDGGANKSGVAPEALAELASAVVRLPGLRLRGLMCIPEPAPDFETRRALFLRAKVLFDRLNAQGLGLDTLSMGMSDDLDAAVAAGSTMVRVGRAVFGSRPAKITSAV
ncbi:YggS family pyridoxal phosphate-dependent enzyme [Hydrogenophaga sp.]|uniref:YggS family pyridoxal phosphate-dependent enzyme n=1 Tax=Hydrogenophaga sp. TaxID=1904254 RepID=UPI002731876A|nr:YggS family pyridoxal phosphate-dependent enzyme [Hydrogenophaga sp.]MDP2015340.1 YggS family pyridoxal phosphate-dependent enzyme [Hydrogenophaga sp.]MDP3168284.1 YggS family pyridoxal phosphate-dependent enzyme [Hydrogenophaga sp.]MDP3810959.1 YggS family pyridoxal phosphate-dependent enzyme [Hydrogenophaga sp.]